MRSAASGSLTAARRSAIIGRRRSGSSSVATMSFAAFDATCSSPSAKTRPMTCSGSIGSSTDAPKISCFEAK